MWKGDHQVNPSTHSPPYATISVMINRWLVLAFAYLIAAATVGIATETNNEETGAAADEDAGVADTPFEYSNDTGAELRSSYMRLKVKHPLPIIDTRSPTSDPCGTPTAQCNCPNSPYRTMDGTCNNLIFTARGSAGSAFSRLQEGRYADDYGKMVTKTANGKLPLPRVLSYELLKDKDVPDELASHTVTAWGQMVAHDASFIMEAGEVPGAEPIQCCTDDGQMMEDTLPLCIPLKIPRDDPFYSRWYIRCLEMQRAATLDTTGCSYSDIYQISAATHYVDMSHSYGNSVEDVNELRSFYKGKLKTNTLHGRRVFPPQADNPTDSCFVDSNSSTCLKSGDFRVNQNLGLAVFQTILLREHNRIAKELHEMHPDWSDETLFQEARKISIAQFQHITYNEFLPKVIGKVLMEELRLKSSKKGFFDFYSPQFDPSTMSEFSAAAYRGLHSLIPGYYDLVDEERCSFKKVLLKNIYNNPGLIAKKHNMEALSLGFVTQPSQSPDAYFTTGVTEYLLRKPGSPFGLDLEATDIQRGRDQGLPTYNDMRHYCGLRRAKNFMDLLDVIPDKYVRRLMHLYNDVDDIEFFVGGVLERRGVMGDYNALVGHTFGCVIGEQFWRWKFGDRYFYDLGNQAGSFTLEQINGIKKTSLAALLCENLYIKYMQPDPFLQVSKKNKLKFCKDIRKMDLSGFKYYTPNPPCGDATTTAAPVDT